MTNPVNDVPVMAAEHRTPSATRLTEARWGLLVLWQTAELLYVFGGFPIPRERASWLKRGTVCGHCSFGSRSLRRGRGWGLELIAGVSSQMVGQ